MTVLPELGSLSLSWCSDQLRLCCLCLHWSDLSRLTWRDLMVRPWQQSCTSFSKVFSHEGHYSNAKGFLSSTCLCAQHDWARTNGSRKLSQFSDQYDQHGIKLLQSHIPAMPALSHFNRIPYICSFFSFPVSYYIWVNLHMICCKTQSFTLYSLLQQL